jgi:hypothetical protein
VLYTGLYCICLTQRGEARLLTSLSWVKLDSTTDQLQALQLSSTTTLASSEREQAALADQLSAERAGREDADRRIQELEQSLARVSEEKVDWQMIATERQAAARMSEVSDAQVTKTPGAVWGCVTRFRSEVADVRCCRYGFMRCHKRMSTGGSSR